MSVRVLLIDEESDARASLALRLRRSRTLELVAAARDLGEASEAVARERPDVLLVDLHHRDGREIELCRSLRPLAAGAPIIGLASYLTAHRWERLRDAGVAQCLLKHVDTDRLGRELVRLVERHQAR